MKLIYHDYVFLRLSQRVMVIGIGWVVGGERVSDGWLDGQGFDLKCNCFLFHYLQEINDQQNIEVSSCFYSV